MSILTNLILTKLIDVAPKQENSEETRQFFFKGILTTPSRVLTWLVLREAKGSFAQGESSVRKEEKHEYFPITSCLSFEIKLN